VDVAVAGRVEEDGSLAPRQPAAQVHPDDKGGMPWAAGLSASLDLQLDLFQRNLFVVCDRS
jgi:hypothetical protein